MSNTKVSIIVPIYNSEAYLPTCIGSILRQTYENIEILLVDDGSTDCSFDVCAKFAEADSRIKVIHQENMGVSAARNIGLDNMTGDFFSFVDSDDELPINSIEILMRDIIEYNADMSSGVFNMVLTDGTIYNPYENNLTTFYSGTDMLRLSLEGDRQTNSACAKLYRRAVLGGVRFVEGKSINEDGFYLFNCYMLKPSVVQRNECVYIYYMREGSNSRNVFSDKYFDMLYFCERKKEIVNNEFPEFSNKLVTMEVSVHLFFLETLCRTNDSKYLEVQNNSIKLVKKYYSVFECANRHERQMAWIVAHGLYRVYNAFVRFKYYR